MHRLADDRLELALRASNEGIWQWAVGAEVVEYSERVLEFFGCSAEEAPHIFYQPEVCFHENDAPRFKRALDQMLEINGKELIGVDCRFIRQDGSHCWLRVRGACVRNDAGEVVRMAGSMIDISKRKTAELALEEERHLLRLLIENIPNNVYFKDTESRFVMVNRATAVKMGYEHSGEIIGKTDFDFFDERHAQKSRAHEVDIMASGEAQEESLEQETWDGQDSTWVITTKIPWLDRKGKVRGTFGVSSDVSDLLNTQIRLAGVADELKQRNQEYEEELKLAREIQQSVIQDKPEGLPYEGAEAKYGACFSMRYEPDREMAGDFFEVIPLSDTSAGVLICDVMGHGMRASLVVAMLRGLVEKERESATHPEWFLYGLNDSLSKILNHAGISMFATAFYAVIDVDLGKLSYASAGHPLPLIRTGGEVKQLSSELIVKGPALGLVPEAPYGCDHLSLAELDQMLLFTDGIYETENAEGEQLGVPAMCQKLNQLADVQSAESSLSTLMEMAADHAAGNGYGDDVCLLGIDFTIEGSF